MKKSTEMFTGKQQVTKVEQSLATLGCQVKNENEPKQNVKIHKQNTIKKLITNDIQFNGTRVISWPVKSQV